MAAYRQDYDARHLQGDCQEPGSAPEPYARQSSMGYTFNFFICWLIDALRWFNRFVVIDLVSG